MDALGIRLPTVVQSLPAPQAPAPVPTKVETVPALPTGEAAFDANSIEQKRFESVQQASKQVAEFFAVSDKTFTIFKDASGQYITRFTSLRDGKVTYIPEPNLLRLGGSSAPVVRIKA